MDIDAEQTELRHYAEAHQQRIDRLRARIDRSTPELRVHEMIKDLADKSQLPYAMRGLVNIPGAEWTTARDVRVFLVEFGVSVPAEWDIRVLCGADDFTVVATNRDDWFRRTCRGVHGRVSTGVSRTTRGVSCSRPLRQRIREHHRHH